MKKRDRKTIAWKGLCVACSLLAGAGLLGGCAKTEVDYSVDETQTGETEHAQSDEERVGLAEFFDEDLTWEEEWSSSDSDGQNLDLQISATIHLPEVKQMSVMEMKRQNMDEEYRYQMLKGFFGEATVYYYDEEHLPKEELQKKIDIERGNLEYLESIWRETEDETDNGIQEYEYFRQETQTRIDDLMRLYDNAPDELTAASEYSADIYAAYLQDVLYKCEFTVFEDGWTSVGFCPVNESEVAPEEFRDAVNIYSGEAYMEMVSATDTNKCSMTEEEARNQAEYFLTRLGIDYVTAVSSSWLKWVNMDDMDMISSVESEEQTCYDGYYFRFGTELDGAALEENYTPNYLYDGYDDSDKQYNYLLNVMICVKDEGVVGCWIENPCEVVSVHEGVSLLPLDSIKSIMRNEAETNGAAYQYDSIGVPRMNSMDLIYTVVQDEENPGSYAYVPAWRLCNKKVGQDRMYCAMLVNAIDGSVIQIQ